jgi:FtsH-binding integral membrane protein
MTEEELYNSLNNHQGESTLHKHELNDALPILMRKVYVWMTLALAITGVVAYGVAQSPNILYSLGSGFLLLCLAEVGLVWYISARIDKLSLSTATTLFIIYSVLNGITLSGLLMIYTMTSIAHVFFITAGTFGIMAFYGYTTKSDLSKFGKILIMALIGIILATIVNIFFHSQGLDMLISYIGVLVFVGLTAWDTQSIKKMLQENAYDNSENSQKMALIGALSLYLDFINLFIYLLRILGRRN